MSHIDLFFLERSERKKKSKAKTKEKSHLTDAVDLWYNICVIEKKSHRGSPTQRDWAGGLMIDADILRRTIEALEDYLDSGQCANAAEVLTLLNFWRLFAQFSWHKAAQSDTI